MGEEESNEPLSEVTKPFGKEEIPITVQTVVSRQTIKQSTSTHISYKGNPNKIDKFMHELFEDLGYTLFKDKLTSTTGSFGEQVIDLDLKVTAVKLVRTKADITRKKRLIFLALAVFGLLIMLFSLSTGPYRDSNGNERGSLVAVLFYGFIGLCFVAAGALLYWFSPQIQKLWYAPGFITMRIDGAGTAYMGTRARKMHDEGSHSARGEHVIQTTYLDGDLDILIGHETEIQSQTWDRYLLEKDEKSEPSLISVLKAMYKRKKEIVVGNKDKYDKLPEGKVELNKIADNDLKEIKQKLMKFSGTH